MVQIEKKCVIQKHTLKDNNIQKLFHEYGEIKELILTSISRLLTIVQFRFKGSERGNLTQIVR